MKFYKMGKPNYAKHPISKNLDYLYNNFKITMGPLTADLMEGNIEINTSTNEVAEYLALTFAVSLLHVLCVPRPSGWKEGKQVMPNARYKNGVCIGVSIPSDHMTFILAAGLLQDTPSNYYIRSRFGMRSCAMCGGFGFGDDEDCITDFSDEWYELPVGEDGVEGWIGGAGFDRCGGCGGCGGGGGGGGGCGGSGGGCGSSCGGRGCGCGASCGGGGGGGGGGEGCGGGGGGGDGGGGGGGGGGGCDGGGCGGGCCGGGP